MHRDDTWTTTPVTDLLRGAVEVERTADGVRPHRLPAWARAQQPDDQLLMVQAQPSGVRLAFRTAATTVELETIPTKRTYVGAPPRPDGVYDLRVDGELVGRGSVRAGHTLTLDMASGASSFARGGSGSVRFSGLSPAVKDVEVWLPHDEATEVLALRTDAAVAPVPLGQRRVWLHHGSSISQGSGAESPSTTWPAVAARLAGVELVNLGLGGSALLDPFTARTIRDTPADLVSVKLGINLVNTDLMRLRAFAPAVHGFLDTIRDGHPATPLLVVSATHCAIHEATPGPSAPDLSAMSRGELRFVATGDAAEVARGRLTLEVIRAELSRIVAQRAAHDPHLHHLDGRELYGEADAAEAPLPDGLHPDAATHRVMGERFAALALEGPFGNDLPSSGRAAS